MKKIYLTNSLTRSKDEFKPIDADNVKLYACGPTVYDRAHLGNARSAVVYDVFYRVLKEIYPKVTYVRNITDVDDKIIAAAKANNEDISDLTKRMEKFYHDDMAALNCLAPDHEPRATEHIADMILMITDLINKGYAYESQRHVLFSVSSFEHYGLLSGRSREEMIAGARVEVAPYKQDPADFVLWKPVAQDEINTGFDSPWGKGRPGWHIECSAMSKAYLGADFDIHGGGADLTFPHHENEIAQSYCANGHGHFAHYWVQNGFLTVNGEKMSKSLGNFVTVHELMQKGVAPEIIRYFYLTTHYRKPLDFNQKAIDDAKKALHKFISAVSDAPPIKSQELLEVLCDDMNTPLALAKLHEYADKGREGELAWGLKLLGINLMKAREIPQQVIDLAEMRSTARANQDWDKSDELRQKIKEMGFGIKDTKDGGYQIIEE